MGIRQWVIALCLVLMPGCTGVPEGVAVVDDFELNRYLGTWYEIARLDHSFERGLSRVSATYSARDDGGVEVVNRGFDEDSGEWKEVKGKGYFVEGPRTGRLKVSFFGPFYGAYNIIRLDRDRYAYSMVCGADRSTLWILSRTRTLDRGILRGLVEYAEDFGFDIEGLIFVDQSPPESRNSG